MTLICKKCRSIRTENSATLLYTACDHDWEKTDHEPKITLNECEESLQPVINFIFEEESSELTFADVEGDQFFVSEEGYLCQKVTFDTFNSIANEKGIPCSFSYDCLPNEPIKCKLPKIKKIEF